MKLLVSLVDPLFYRLIGVVLLTYRLPRTYQTRSLEWDHLQMQRYGLEPIGWRLAGRGIRR